MTGLVVVVAAAVDCLTTSGTLVELCGVLALSQPVICESTNLHHLKRELLYVVLEQSLY